LNLAELDDLLAELRRVRTDHQGVEAKRAGRALPATTAETLSAFANTDGGGLLLLGVHENSGEFNVTGVDNVQQIQSDLQAQCSLMEPQLRVSVDLIEHPDGVVVAAVVPPVPRDQRPCHIAVQGAHASSYIRVGDGDQHLEPGEVTQMLANRTNHDHSTAPAPTDAQLDPELTASLIRRVRAAGSTKYADMPDDVLLRQFAATDETDHPTLAGYLTMGYLPEQRCPAAQVTYRRHPTGSQPAGTRYAGKHLEGTIGELLDDTLAAIEADLNTIQVVRAGRVYDELDVPREALREVLSNALIHRSLTPGQRDSSILVEVSDAAVVITSPGNLYASSDTASLGLAPVAGARNYALVRQAVQLRTPTGARISEHQNSGIAAADRACRDAGTMPVLFVDRPITFQAILLRGAINLTTATSVLVAALPATDTTADAAAAATIKPAHVRLLAVLHRLEAERERAISGLSSIAFDSRFAARALASTTSEDAAAELRALENAGLIQRTRLRLSPTWVPAPVPAPARTPSAAPLGPTQSTQATPTPSQDQAAPPAAAELKPAKKPRRQRQSRVPDLLAAIAATPEGKLTAKAIGQALGLSSPSSRNRWIRQAEDAGLIASTVDNPYNPHGGYALTVQGRMTHEAELRKTQR
jgi:ATP-dependent DNA helicase RecG